ncbi:excinuclease ABC subunit A, partial [Candidatus Vampirococcus lugosii]|nr:excinuclease ABC subunit A [Candidatus Vampirococcus lugosii]
MENNDFSKLIIKGARTNNLNNIDITLPKNKLITITGVSGSGKSTLAFNTIYKEGQFRYIESLSSYLRQFFNLGERPDVDYCQGFSPAIAIEQNKKVGNSRSTVGTMTEVDDYLRLLFAKLGDIYCYSCNKEIKAQTTDNIYKQIIEKFEGEKIYILQYIGDFKEENDLLKFTRKNRKQVDAGKGSIRIIIQLDNFECIEYFYLEDPKIPKGNFPIKVYGIYDRISLEDKNLSRLKEGIVKILLNKNKVGIYQNGNITWYTDKNFCPDCDIIYPDFTTQHFSPNRQEGACETCHGLGQTLQVDLEKMIDKNSKYLEAILPWRDSGMG